MKTVEQVIEDWRQDREDLAQREAHWHERRRSFNRRVLIISAIVYALTFRAQAFGGTFAAFLWLPTLAVGALSAWPIARWRLGPLLAPAVFMAGAMGWELIALAIGALNGAPVQSGNFIMPGGPLVMVSTWAFWALYGTVLGLITAQEDDDTIQV